LVTRRASREPLQHLTGRAYFRHVELAVGPGVFVPRPETEELAGWVIDHLRAHGAVRPVVVDLCTGSGAIALAIATEVPSAVVHAVELDPVAHGWAVRNLEGAGVDLALGDLVDAFHELDGTVDVVVANPPYIPLDAWESVEPEVRDHDPAVALWVEGDGLAVVRAVERVAARLLRGGGVLAVEHATAQAASAPSVFTSTGVWHEVRDHPDLAGRSRFVTATRVERASSVAASPQARTVR
jgi:release factor glutamine methyltransferase